MVGLAVSEATGTDSSKKRPKNDVSDRRSSSWGRETSASSTSWTSGAA